MKQHLTTIYYGNKWFDTFIDMATGALIYDVAVGGGQAMLIIIILTFLLGTKKILEEIEWNK